ncbi:hypothetical protein Nepgr_007495 [Nepenthes gracilis]|uniref:Uncharacterized protein n=1 Tax=Nepenthes gracilis TaxID=150966 RepID=A0AAD3XIH8_NEPGR|nr:hypothetical protein Nepgr_007495 [Nepenthes gracilis]
MASKMIMIVSFLFDVAAFCLALAAELKRSTAMVAVDDHLIYSYCVYDSSIATAFGLGAVLLLLASQVLIMAATHCFCCQKGLSPGAQRAWAIVLFITCWVIFLTAEMCLVVGSVKNSKHTKYRTLFGTNPPHCQTLGRFVFGAGAAFVFVNGVVSKLYYICYSKAKGSFELEDCDTKEDYKLHKYLLAES